MENHKEQVNMKNATDLVRVIIEAVEAHYKEENLNRWQIGEFLMALQCTINFIKDQYGIDLEMNEKKGH